MLTNTLDSLLLTIFFNKSEKKTGINLEQKSREANGDINVQTTQLKFNIPTFILMMIAVIGFTVTITRMYDNFVFENKELNRISNEIKANTKKIDSTALSREQKFNDLQKEIDSLKKKY